MVSPARIRPLNNRPTGDGRYVLYWMQASQRAWYNHALEYAIDRGNELRRPVVVCFGLDENYPEANLRHYRFMLDGLADAAGALRRRGMAMVVRRGNPADVAADLAADASLVVCDRGYLRHQAAWRRRLAEAARCAVVEVEADAVVPVDAASGRLEVAARTLRPKLRRVVDGHLTVLRAGQVVRDSLSLDAGGDVDPLDVEGTLAGLKVDRSVPPSPFFQGGLTAGRKRLGTFLGSRLRGYAEGRSEPSAPHTSLLSPYLHFGHISPLEPMLRIQRSRPAPPEDCDAFIEQLLVRRELSLNFVTRNPHYDRYEGLPAWARATLEEHVADRRRHVYSRQELEAARTHDELWNAAQKEMVLTGYMHNHMRMYWGKMILAWKATPREAFEDALYLNNRYLLDGRDPNSYAGVGWIFGLHDRPWPPRPVFGTVRSMTRESLERKIDAGAYMRMVAAIETGAGPGAGPAAGCER